MPDNLTPWRKQNKPFPIWIVLLFYCSPFITLFTVGVLINGPHF